MLQAMPSGRLLTGDATGLAQLWRYSDPALLEAIVSLDPRTAFAPVAPYGETCGFAVQPDCFTLRVMVFSDYRWFLVSVCFFRS